MNYLKRDTGLSGLLETDGLRILHYDFVDPCKYSYHSYESTRICTILNGAKKVRIGCQDFVADESEFIVLPPYSNVNLEIASPTSALVVEIFDKLIENILAQTHFYTVQDPTQTTSDQIIHPKKTAELEYVLGKIKNASTQAAGNKDFLVHLYVQEFTYHLLQNQYLPTLPLVKDNFVRLAIQIMEEHLIENLTMTNIAAALHMSPANFSSKFKHITGISPNKYMTDMKLAYAKKQLQHNHKNVTEISFELGYENISHFIGLFKEKYGITPKQFKKSWETSPDTSCQKLQNLIQKN